MMRPFSIHQELHRLDTEGLLRVLRALPATGGRFPLNGREVLNFSSNDYLNLATDRRLKEAATAAIEDYGCGATASRLMAGHLTLHEALEKKLAALVHQEAALVFPTGFQANLGVLTALASEDDIVFSDALNHASIVDGCRLSRASINVYRHNDVEHLETLLANASSDGKRIIVTDTVFSMDGDLAHVMELSRLAARYDALLIVDEAHAIGVHGNGAGLCAERGVQPDIIVGTMSKALGGEGGFAAGSHAVRELLVNKARSFIFSTGLAPPCAGSAMAAVSVVHEEPDLGAELLRRAQVFRIALQSRGVDVGESVSQIIPLIVGENGDAVALSEALLGQGLLVTAVRPPSVPEGSARLRFSLTLAHTDTDLVHAAEVVASAQLHAGVQ